MSILYLRGERYAAKQQLKLLRDYDMTRRQTNLLAATETIRGLIVATEISFNEPNETTRNNFRSLCGDMMNALVIHIRDICENELVNILVEAFRRAYNSPEDAEREAFRNTCGEMLKILAHNIDAACAKEFSN